MESADRTASDITEHGNEKNQMDQKNDEKVSPELRLSIISSPKEDLSKDNTTTTSHEYEEVLDIIGFGKVQLIVLLTCGLLLMMVINETMGMSIITIASQCDFATSAMEKAIMSGAAFIGILCSSYFWGYLSDAVGRKPVLVYSTLTGNLVSFVSIFIPDYWTFVVLRFIVGIFIAGASSTTYAYLGEFLVPRHRPIMINYATMFVGVALTYVPAVAWLVLSMDWSFFISESFEFRPWRLLTIFNILPGFLAILIMFALPDSPKILMAMHKTEDFFKAVSWIAKINTGRTLADLQVYKLKGGEMPPQSDKILHTSKSAFEVFRRMWNETSPLFKKPHALNFLISCALMCGLFLINSGMGLWYPEIQNRLGSRPEGDRMTICQVIDAAIEEQQGQNKTNLLCDDTITNKSYMDSTTFGLAYTFGYLILGLIINPLGRKLTIILALVLAAVFGILLHWLLHPIAIVVSFILFLMLPGLCVSAMSGAVVDLVPTSLRGKAVCICFMLGRSGSVIGSNIVASILEDYCNITFGVFYVLALVCAVLAYVLPI